VSISIATATPMPRTIHAAFTIDALFLRVRSLGRERPQFVESGGGRFFDQVEAMFALWEMQMREHEVPGAVATARVLTCDFPENRELGKFLTTFDSTTLVINPVDGVP
jgi:hypothetical protein